MEDSLLERQLICRNMTVDGEYLSYVDNGSSDVGLYVDKKKMYDGSYFEIEIQSLGEHRTIAIGCVPYDYPENTLPGCGPRSIGYNAADGLLYEENGSGTQFGPKCGEGDIIGCGFIPAKMFHWTVVFTRNGEKIGERSFSGWGDMYSAVGMHSCGEKVKVKLDAKMPANLTVMKGL